MNQTRCAALAALLLSAGARAETSADYIETRHGAAPGWPLRLTEGGITAVGQTAGDDRADAELTASLDLLFTLDHGPGHWSIYIEGNTTPDPGGVALQIPDANGDAGSALDRRARGRLQFSEFHYVWPISERRALLAGLIDPTTSLDTSEIANDETAQFLTASLINNPTIGFPDYTLGVVYNHGFSDGHGFTLMLTGSHGLADNPKATYAELFELGEEEKGVFAATEYQWTTDGLRLVAGAWLNGGDHEDLDGSGDSHGNHGVYASLDLRTGGAGWNLRAGAADDRVSRNARFLSTAVEYPLERIVLGAGVARSWLSGRDATPGLDHATQVELHARFELDDHVSLTPVVQWLEHPGFEADGARVDARVTVFAVRANVTF